MRGVLSRGWGGLSHAMSELTDLLLASTDPVNALLLLVLAYYARQIKHELRREIRQVRGRVERLEDHYIPADPYYARDTTSADHPTTHNQHSDDD